MVKTRKSLWAAGFALLVCILLLIGTTFAWFTDSVSNSGNKIQAGSLEVSFAEFDPAVGGYVNVGEEPIFDYDKWEPGYTDVACVKIGNEGTLALKYQLDIIVDGDVGNLADVIDVYYVEDTEARTSLPTGTTEMTRIGTLSEVLNSAGEDGVAHGDLLAGEADFATIALHMQENAGNEYQNVGIGTTFDINLSATQMTYEKDGFNNSDYDENAMYDNGDGTFSQNGKTYVEIGQEYIEVTAHESVQGLYNDSDGTNYISSGAAVNYVFENAENGEHITLIDNVTFSATGSSPFLTVANATIDLNDKVITVEKGYDSNSFGVTGNNSVVKNGTFKCGEGRDDYPLWITGNIGKNHVTVENVAVDGGMQVTGTVEATLSNVTINANNYYDVYMAQNSKVTVESGSFTSVGNKPHFYIQNYGASYNPTIIVNGGNFSGGMPTVGVANAGNPYTFVNNID